MSGHRPWAYISHKAKKCKKLTIEGKRCNKPLGSCIHNYKPTLFGARPQV